MYSLPQELVSYIYTFDSTYKEKFTRLILIFIDIASWNKLMKKIKKNNIIDRDSIQCQKRYENYNNEIMRM